MRTSDVDSNAISVGVEQACRLIGIKRSSFYKLIQPAGGLKTFRVGSRRLVRRAELDRFLMSMESKLSGEPSGISAVDGTSNQSNENAEGGAATRTSRTKRQA
jgi:excisionase family DNA binding protein